VANVETNDNRSPSGRANGAGRRCSLPCSWTVLLERRAFRGRRLRIAYLGGYQTYGFTVNVAVLLPLPAVGVCVVFTPEVVLGWDPLVVLVTLNVTVQLELAGMVIPVKLSAVAPAVNVLGVVPVHVPPTAPPEALIFESVSVNAPPVSAVVLLLVKVNVTVEDPPD
jgi:hypothetical protein